MYSILIAIFCSAVIANGWLQDSKNYRERMIGESTARFRGKPESRIIGGENATIEEYPFAVSLQNNGTFFGYEVEHFCGGGIIGEKWIITSAQCALRMQTRKYHVRAGTAFYYKDGGIYDVKGITIHPMFNGLIYDYDFGIIELSESLQFDNTKQPIKLPKAHSTIKDGAPVFVIGWGATKMLEPYSDELQMGVTTKISNEDCGKESRNVLTKQMLCVQSDKLSPCVGDSGSPLIFNGILYGVASWSESCDYEYPTAYAAVSEVTDWITQVTGLSSFQ